MTFRKLWAPLLAAILLPLLGYSQSPDLIWSPELSYSWKSSDRLGFNAKLSVFNSARDLDNDFAIRYIEPQFSFSYGLSPGTKVGGGYYYRWSTPLVDGYQYEHRLLQQIGYVSYIGDRRISHRLRTEQRFRSSSYQNRIRYRFSYDFPLEGQKLDAGEKYLILKNEAMTAFNKDATDAENRAHVGLGWYFNDKQKFELGLQYRTQDIFSGNGVSHLFLFHTAYYINR